MRKHVLTHIIPILFVAAFLVPRVVDLHVFSHLSDEDTSISCELCDTLVYSYQLDLITNNASYVEDSSQNIPSSFVVCSPYNIPQEKIVSPTSIHNKPPPLC